MSNFDECKLMITADVVFDSDEEDSEFNNNMMNDICEVLNRYSWLYKNVSVGLYDKVESKE